MASDRHATRAFICICFSFLLPAVNQGAIIDIDYENGRSYPNDDSGVRLTREYHLRQGALRGLIVKPSRQYDLQSIEMFLGIPYAAPPTGNLRFMPPVSAPPWPGLKRATRFAPVCPQTLPPVKKGDPPSLGRQHYMNRLKPFLGNESEDCLYLNIYVPYREQKPKKFPVLVFIHGDSFEWSSGNPYDGRILASYGNIMVVTVNFRLGILGFMKPSLTEHVYGNSGLLDQLAALQWIKDNIEDLNGDSRSVTLMGHGTGAASISFLMLSPISNGLFHRAILMSGSAMSDWAMTKDPTQYTMQVAQSLGCNPASKNMMNCLQNKPLSEIKKVQILAREFETPLGPIVAGSFIPNEPFRTMEAFPTLLSKYQLLTGVTELERYHDFGVIELTQGVLENQRDEFINKYAKIIFNGAEDEALKEILKQYAVSKLDPQRWSVETNRDVILDLFNDARTLAPLISFLNYHSKANRQSYFYVFGHNSISTEYAALNKSVHGEELPYVLGVPLGGAHTHFHSEYTPKEKLLSEAMMRLWTNFVKMGTPNTQSINEYYSMDRQQWHNYNVEWPEYNMMHQSYLRLDIPPFISSLYRSNYTNFWIDYLPNKMRRYVIDPMFEYTSAPSTVKPKSTHRNNIDQIRKLLTPRVVDLVPRNTPSQYGKVMTYSQPIHRPDPETKYREIESIKTSLRPAPPALMEKPIATTNQPKTVSLPVKTSGATITLIITLGILFLAVNVSICAILYFKKRKLHVQERIFETSRRSGTEIGEIDIIGQKSSKDDKSALRTLKNGCNVIKSMSVNKIRKNSGKQKKKLEQCKTPKSDDSGGFRERFQLRRHLSTSTLDAHTKVRDWIANEVMHRCSPSITRKSKLDLNTDIKTCISKPYTRSEELLTQTNTRSTLKVNSSEKSKTMLSKASNKTKNSKNTTSKSALGSYSSINSTANSANDCIKNEGKSSESFKSKGTGSISSNKISVAIDATPAARTNSILEQEPIEISKSFDCSEHSIENIQKCKTKDSKNIEISPDNQKIKNSFTNEVTVSLRVNPIKISHKHSTSDPVTDVNYDKLKEKLANSTNTIEILPPVSFRNDINVTSRDEHIIAQNLTAAEALLTIQRRNYPKVLPDLPISQKRLSLQPAALQTFRKYTGSNESHSDRFKVPPQPPPRTTTLDRQIAYRNTRNVSSFNTPNKKVISDTDSVTKNYENIDTISSYDANIQRFFNQSSERCSSNSMITPRERCYPKVIIASNDIPNEGSKIYIKPNEIEIPSNAPRVKLPEDFHSHITGSVTSFSSFCSEDDDELIDDINEDQLINELVGGVQLPVNISDDLVFDTKGPATIFEKKLDIIPVKVYPGHIVPKNKNDNMCVTNLHLPDVSDLERTAQIKPNFGLNKLKQRSESIQKPPEMSVEIKPKKSVKPTTILNKTLLAKRKRNSSNTSAKLKHSNSGSSNDTETSTGTVKKVEIKKS